IAIREIVMKRSWCRIMAERSSTASTGRSKHHCFLKRFTKSARWIVQIGVGETQDFPLSQCHRVVSLDIAFPRLASRMELEPLCFDDHLRLWPGEIDEPEREII